MFAIILLSCTIGFSVFQNAHAVSERSITHAGSVVWARTYGDPGQTYVYSVKPTRDGGYIAAGWIDSKAWVFKLDSFGNIEWQEAMSIWHTQDSLYYTYAISAVQTPDDTYLVLGSGGFHDKFGCCYSWMAKLDSRGAVKWFKEGPKISSLSLTKDNNFILSGESIAYNGASTYGWLEKIDSTGAGWARSYDAPNSNLYGKLDTGVASAHQTSDGGFIAAGHLGVHLWIFKTDQNGAILWQKIYDAPGAARSILEISGSKQGVDNDESHDSRAGSLIAQEASKNNDSRNGFLVLVGASYLETNWIIRLDDRGNIVWSKTYSNNNGYSMTEAQPGEYVVAGIRGLFKISTDGNIIWSRAYSGPTPSRLLSVTPTRDWGFVLTGWAGDPDSQAAQAWILKVNSEGICCRQMTRELPMTTGSTPSHVVPANATASPTWSVGGPDIYFALLTSNAAVQTQCSPSQAHSLRDGRENF